MTVVVWFLTICSIVVHGLSIPLGKLGFFLPRTLSRAFTSQTNSQTDLAIGARVYTSSGSHGALGVRRRGNVATDSSGASGPQLGSGTASRPIYRVGGSVIRTGSGVGVGGSDTPEADSNLQMVPVDGPVEGRTIRFPDEEVHVVVGRGDSEV